MKHTALAAACVALAACTPQAVKNAAPPINPLNAQRAYGYLQQLCAIGPRPSGSPGMQQQQAVLEDFFKKAGGKAEIKTVSGGNTFGNTCN